jgi:hypothetical protein
MVMGEGTLVAVLASDKRNAVTQDGLPRPVMQQGAFLLA